MNATTNDIKRNSTATVIAQLERLRSSPKLVLAIAAAAALSLIIGLVFWAQTPEYRVLYTNISDQDGGAVVSQLSQMNIPYRFTDRGGAITVPADKVYEARLKLAQLGLPKGGEVGFELLDQEKFGISQFSEQVNFQRALEGELSRTIETLGPVHTVRVHLAIPKPSMFVREQKVASASVTVTLNSGRSLDSGQVNAITYLISSAVPGLNADHVTVVDQNGRLLTQSGEQAIQTSHLKYTSDLEADYQQRIQAILAPIVGHSNVKAQVTAQLDFTLHEQTDEAYQPNTDVNKMAIRSRQNSISQQGGRNAVGGVPGALSNQAPTPAAAPLTRPLGAGAVQNSTSQTSTAASQAPASAVPYNNRQDETTNYEVNRTLTHTKRNLGEVERLSVAVVVNYLPGKGGKPAALTKEQLAQIDTLVKEAVGYSAQRGDTVNVINSPFSTVEEDAPPPFWKQQAFFDLLMYAARYLFIAIVAWVLWRKLVQPAWIRHQEAVIHRLELEREARQAQLDAHKINAEKSEREKAEQRVEVELNTQKLRDLAEQEPRVIALVIRQWINKDMKQQ
ncbi:flagellar M-ring protein FliF [Pluralibacter gergoviae]|uniref:flagellar basal-body MS-ring/collar protein FliF n=1 Tax=Pluralibacter gergoviae TaxID=61647 RepID=UPI0006521955|nr:flagellar basal-body MS-ring/collar protein FliF [Pluralibacter gergoviae]ELD4300704.1 flagellar M-ring protein FliF [Pluralibacter gergoviae]ELG9930111.1 flagellar M-ring protein FliF [Pluralibacter gergoviae]ELK5593062.1 flagellar M-ring protein FliF [Pluralibacter gergoviae]ELN2738616.1 flagellar M-ring protein FliF [Pluralibacter gergoviae]KMK33239.1 flagellar MS-ring protein [Pluralibacter gergoviae]